MAEWKPKGYGGVEGGKTGVRRTKAEIKVNAIA